jgi:hypothetical protein
MDVLLGNADGAIAGLLFKMTVFRLSQSLNAYSSICSTLLGRVIVVRLLQPAKA